MQERRYAKFDSEVARKGANLSLFISCHCHRAISGAVVIQMAEVPNTNNTRFALRFSVHLHHSLK